MIVDFTEQLWPITALSNTTPASTLVPDNNCEFSFNTVPGFTWTPSPRVVPFSTQAGPVILAFRPTVMSPLANTATFGGPIILASRGRTVTIMQRTQVTTVS